LLDTWVAARPVNPDDLVPVSHEQLEALEALGY